MISGRVKGPVFAAAFVIYASSPAGRAGRVLGFSQTEKLRGAETQEGVRAYVIRREERGGRTCTSDASANGAARGKDRLLQETEEVAEEASRDIQRLRAGHRSRHSRRLGRLRLHLREHLKASA